MGVVALLQQVLQDSNIVLIYSASAHALCSQADRRRQSMFFII